MWNCSKKVSVIVPIYQKENYIDKAVKTLLEQTYSQIEILLIDDGSGDTSLLKCRMWEERESKVHVYHHNNRGVSYTRNVGILYASGDYLMFMDADDTLAENAIEKMVYEMEKNHTDMCVCGYLRENYGQITDYLPSTSGVFSKTQFLEQNFKKLYQKHILHNIGTKMYRRDILLEKNVCFREGYTVCEDIIFCLEYIRAIQTICVINEALYIYYCDDAASVNHNYREDFLNNVFDLNKNIMELIGKNKLFYTILINNMYSAFLNELLADCYDKHVIREKISNICSCKEVMGSKWKVQLAELTWEQRFFAILVWYKQLWLIEFTFKIKKWRARGKGL